MSSNHTALEALSGEGFRIGFELVKADATWVMTEVPQGELGHVTNQSPQGFDVRFDSGCSLRVQMTVGDSPMCLCHAEILSCDLNEPFIILIRASLANRTQPYFMIPATIYGTNNADRGVVAGSGDGVGQDPKLTYRSDGPSITQSKSPSWHFRCDRGAASSVSATFDDRFLGLGIREVSDHVDGHWLYNSLGIWTSTTQGDSISVAMGAMDWPSRQLVSHLNHEEGVHKPVFEPITKEAAVGLTTEFCIYATAANDRFAYEPFMVEWYDWIHESPRAGAPLAEAMRDVADALMTDGIRPDWNIFHMFLDDRGYQAGTLLAWAGLLQIARPLILAAEMLGEKRYVQRTAEMVDRAVAGAFSARSGLFACNFDGQWQPEGWWGGLGQNSLVNGHACWLLLKMYEDDETRTSWAEAARKVLSHVVGHQRNDGRLPTGFNPEDGSPLTYTGFGGCFFVAPLLMSVRLFDDDVVKAAAIKALEHYWEEFTQLEWIGVDLDCGGAVDSYSSYALTRALVEYHRQDATTESLDRLGHVLHYACSYHYGYNTRHRNPVCDWSSSGSKITSTPNSHIDAEAGALVEDVAYYLDHRDDAYFRSRLKDVVDWSRQCYNRYDGEYGWGKKGWVFEQYYNTYMAYNHPIGDGTIWQGYFPWAAGVVLDALVIGSRMGRS